MKRFLSILALVLSICIASYGRGIDNEFSAELTGGLSAMYYSHTGGNYDPMPGTSGGVTYLHHFNDSWGFGTGAGVRLYQSRIRFNEYSDEYPSTASPILDGNATTGNFTFSYRYTDLEDKQRALYLTIPVFAQYQHEVGFYTRLGVQLGIPISGGSTIRYGELRTKGFFPHENVIYDNLPQHGFGTYYGGNIDDIDIEMSYRVNTSLLAEVGWKWNWFDQYVLYLGVTGEYGFCNMIKREITRPQLVYNDGDFIYTPIWEANAKSGNERNPVTGAKVHSYAFSLVLRYSFGW